MRQRSSQNIAQKKDTAVARQRTALERVEVAVELERAIREVQRDLVEVVAAGGARDEVEHRGVGHAVHVDRQHADLHVN
jgi:hypothetical protein